MYHTYLCISNLWKAQSLWSMASLKSRYQRRGERTVTCFYLTSMPSWTQTHIQKKHLTQTHSKHIYTNTLVYILSVCNFNLSWAEAHLNNRLFLLFEVTKLTYHEWQQGALKMNSFLWSWWLVEPAANNWFRAGARGTSNTLISFTFLILIFIFTFWYSTDFLFCPPILK